MGTGGVKLATQTTGVTVDGACRNRGTLAPDRKQEVLLCADAGWIASEMDKQLVLEATKLDWRPGNTYQMGTRIDLQGSNTKACAWKPLSTAEQRLQASAQLYVAVIFSGDEVIGAHLKRTQQIELSGTWTENDHGQLLVPGRSGWMRGRSAYLIEQVERFSRRIERAEQDRSDRLRASEYARMLGAMGERGPIAVGAKLLDDLASDRCACLS
jgi:hypothetical protein